MVNNLFRILIFLIIMISCNEKKLIDKFKDFDQRGWISDTPSIFNFSTKDLDYITNVSLRIKYDIEYPYQNLYYNFNILDSIDTIVKKELNEMILFDEINGKPLGSGISKTFILDEKIIENLTLKKNSSFSIHIYQKMREKNLIGIKSIGVLVKKN